MYLESSWKGAIKRILNNYRNLRLKTHFVSRAKNLFRELAPKTRFVSASFVSRAKKLISRALFREQTKQVSWKLYQFHQTYEWQCSRNSWTHNSAIFSTIICSPTLKGCKTIDTTTYGCLKHIMRNPKKLYVLLGDHGSKPWIKRFIL